MSKLTGNLVALSLLTCLVGAVLLFGVGARTSSARGIASPLLAPTPPRITSNERIRQTGQFSRGIFGKISWKVEYGFPSVDGGATAAKELNCTAFRVLASVQEGASGTFGNAENVGFFATDPEPAQVNGYYVCNYKLADTNQDFPHGKPITVKAILGPYASAQLNQALTQGAWYGDGNPKPSPGHERVPVGARAVTLTDAEPRATVDFVLEYRPLPSRPR